MRILLAALLIASLSGISGGQDQNPVINSAEMCKYTLTGDRPATPVITGPDEIVGAVRIIEQPDSPIEILSIDYTGSWLAVSHGQFTERTCLGVRVRNRSDRAVTRFKIEAGSTGLDSRKSGVPSLAPGQEFEIPNQCRGGGTGSMQNDQYRILVTIPLVEMGGCAFGPPVAIPYNWREATPGAQSSSCKFRVPDETPPPPVIRGGDSFASLIRNIDQTDTPLQILEVDYRTYDVFIGDSEYRRSGKCLLRLKNRSDQRILGYEITVGLNSGAMRIRGRWAGLAPGEEIEVNDCGTTGGGSGTRIPPLRVYHYVESVEIAGCRYAPSRILVKEFPEDWSVAENHVTSVWPPPPF
ncbi:MAG TPA: hypothetical protein VGA40_01875 [Candidatus Acidoferrales bacterium]